jgi:hypothetical protein
MSGRVQIIDSSDESDSEEFFDESSESDDNKIMDYEELLAKTNKKEETVEEKVKRRLGTDWKKEKNAEVGYGLQKGQL